jgi:hypothetical protein
LTKEYETPVYVRSLRPARFTCEKCHYPEKFSTDSVREIQKYLPDDKNSEIPTWLVMKTGGGSQREGLGKGIHWHIENEVWYLPTDELRQQIPYVRKVDADGKVTEYYDAEADLPADFIEKNSDQLRRMDCTDCHNRISHQFTSPEKVLDEALGRLAIDRSIPEIKRVGVEALSKEYSSHEEAENAIRELETWYQETYPDYYATNRDSILQAIEILVQEYKSTVFPDMDVGWETHPDNIGHSEFPGCFRCHDGKHVSPDNSTIRLECNICHTIPEVVTLGSPAPSVSLEKPSEPASHLDSNWLAQHRYLFDENCADCHSVTNPGGSDNSSFCSNSACHATEWKFAGLDAPEIRALSEPLRGPSSGVPRPIPHPTGPRTDCTLCHGPEGVHPAPESHVSFTADMCTGCHASAPQPTAAAAPADAGEETPEAAATAVPTVQASEPPGIPHPVEVNTNCEACHGLNGVRPYPENHTAFTPAMCQNCHQPLVATTEATATPERTATRTITPTSEAEETSGPPATRTVTPTSQEVDTATPAPTAGATAQATPTSTARATVQATATGATSGAGEAPTIPHELAGREDCTLCHGPGMIKPNPPDHAGRSVETCQVCHKPSS